MRSPEEIKKGLSCTSETADCEHCAYCTTKADEDGWDWPEFSCSEVEYDALAYIQQLESRIAQVERENEALRNDLKLADAIDCTCCIHNQQIIDSCDCDCNQCKEQCVCNTCRNNDKYEWRGVCAENRRGE